ncbi:MAG: helix-turn-helix domain-containing protein [Candidatus Riflebacteria bacterium]|nr:helix-turn-helix domain-containing protein [Candidatus Riflebacteria bacterium]
MPRVPLERTSKLLKDMINLYDQGMNKTQIAIMLGMSPGYVGRLMKKAGYNFEGRTKKSSLETSNTSEVVNKLLKNFGIFLVYCRTIVLKLEVNAMASKLKVTATKLHQLEKGLVNLTVIEWLEYLKILKVNPAEVLAIMQKEDLEKYLMRVSGVITEQ